MPNGEMQDNGAGIDRRLTAAHTSESGLVFLIKKASERRASCSNFPLCFSSFSLALYCAQLFRGRSFRHGLEHGLGSKMGELRNVPLRWCSAGD